MIDLLVTQLKADLRDQSELCAHLLKLSDSENEMIAASREPDWPRLVETRKKMLAQLGRSLDKIKNHRTSWVKLEPAVRAAYPEVTELMRRNQNLIMKVVVLDRKNEELFLRKGLVPPAAMPSVNKQRPHFVADMYRRHGTG